MPLSFDDTETAFAGKSNADIRRAYWLFKIINNNFLVKVGPPLTNLALLLHLPVKGLIKKTIFRHFCGGETITECNETVISLAKQGVGSILDYSVEGKEVEEDFNKTSQEIVQTIHRSKGDNNIPFCVFKVTGIAGMNLLEKVSAGKLIDMDEVQEWEKVRARFNLICKTAFENDVRIFIDAEETWIQQAVDDLADEQMIKFNKRKAIIFNTIQLYRIDRIEFLKKSFQHSLQHNYFPGYKLVRGAYMEKERAHAIKNNYPSPIHKNKTACDADYDLALRFCIDHVDKISFCASTHNEMSSMLLAGLMITNNISKSNPHIWFSQLLGMSDHISYNLAKEGFNVCKYVPYGPVTSVLPYLFRRAAENTSISGMMGRELSLIVKEIKRIRINLKAAH